MKSRILPQAVFYGWWVAAASFFTLGVGVGLPYYGMPFFYDYFERPVTEGGFGWSRSSITFGLPLGTLATLWVGPLLAHRLSPRHLILVGTGLTALTLIGFGRMSGSIQLYCLLWLVYMVGNVFSGPLAHQILLSHWFSRHRGTALSIAYLGISVIGAFSARYVVQPLTDALGFRGALQVMGCLMFLTWPFILFVMRERPSDLGLQPDGFDAQQEGRNQTSMPTPLRHILSQRTFWILLVGGSCFAGAIGAISQHLKLILKDSGFTEQRLLDQSFSQTLLVLLIASAVGRLLVGWLSDRFPKRHILTTGFVLLTASLSFLYFLTPPTIPYSFAVLYGLSTGADFLLVALLAADYFDVSSLARVLAILLPVMTVGQTWSPYLIAVLQEQSGNYRLPLVVVFLLAMFGRMVMALLPDSPNNKSSAHSM